MDDSGATIPQLSVIKRKTEKAKWSAEEDEILKKAVALHGPCKDLFSITFLYAMYLTLTLTSIFQLPDRRNWKLIASYLDGKTEVQCLHRVVELVAVHGAKK